MRRSREEIIELLRACHSPLSQVALGKEGEIHTFQIILHLSGRSLFSRGVQNKLPILMVTWNLVARSQAELDSHFLGKKHPSPLIKLNHDLHLAENRWHRLSVNRIYGIAYYAFRTPELHIRTECEGYRRQEGVRR